MTRTPETLETLIDAVVTALDGQPRSGQLRMAKAIEDSLDSKTHVLIQAGTGTGKSLAYLVPVLRHAAQTGEKIVISTATLALQGQILGKDVPTVTDALHKLLPDIPRIAVLKGRRNYACKYKIAGGYPADEDSTLFDMGADDFALREDGASDLVQNPSQTGTTTALGEQIRRVRQWETTTQTGDRDDMPRGVSDKAWARVSVSSSECIGKSCPMIDECYAEAAKTAAWKADIVITNHALVAINAFGEGGVLPEHDALIVDEAHELVSSVTTALTGTLSAEMVERALKTVTKHAAGDKTLRARLGEAAQSLRLALENCQPGLMTPLPEDIVATVEQVRSVSRALLSVCQQQYGEAKGTKKETGLHMSKTRIEEILDLANRFIEAGDNDVTWIQGAPDSETSLLVAPLNTAHTLQSGLFSQATIVATSATLALGGTFKAVATQWGLHDEEEYQALDVGSPFDYSKQGILYVASHLPQPHRDGLGEPGHKEIEDLLTASRGGALGLFSSRRAALLAAEHMRDRLDLPILVQGEDSLGALVREFREDPSASLFGTLSLWQGVDAPGATNRLVIIDRLPFPRPDDPLVKARTQRITSQGGNGFMSVSAVSAATKLAQGVGRLIRSSSDKGVVAVLDSRLRTARYARFLLSSVPPMWLTENREVILGALERLSGEVIRG